MSTVPPAPSNIHISLLNNTHIHVSWSPLSLNEARGYIQLYTVTYTNSSGTYTLIVPPAQSSVEIMYYMRGQTYSVQMSASTSAGEGSNSAPEEVVLPSVESMTFACRQL